ncbi:unnamed protein product [Withania somnifera]
MENRWAEKNLVNLPESPKAPMEFLSRSWSASALQVCKALTNSSSSSPSVLPKAAIANKNSSANNNSTTNSSSSSSSTVVVTIPENMISVEEEDSANKLAGNAFSFASSATSQLVLERIMSQSMHNGQEISPLTSGRLSHSSGPLNGSLTEETDSPPVSPSEEFEDVVKYLKANSTLQPLFTNVRNGYSGSAVGLAPNTPGGKTVGRWLKERREKRKKRAEPKMRNSMLLFQLQELLLQWPQLLQPLHQHPPWAKMSKWRRLMLLLLQQQSLRGAATLKARALKEVWNIAAVIPIEKGIGGGTGRKSDQIHSNNSNSNSNNYCEGLDIEENFLGVCNQELLARGRELLKRTRNGDLHWKIVSVYIHRSGEVMLKMKSKHVGKTITKKKKNVVLEVYKDVPAWPGRHLFEDGEKRRYFGLKTDIRGVVEFECKNQREYEMWTQGVSRLLSMVAERKKRFQH